MTWRKWPRVKLRKATREQFVQILERHGRESDPSPGPRPADVVGDPFVWVVGKVDGGWRCVFIYEDTLGQCRNYGPILTRAERREFARLGLRERRAKTAWLRTGAWLVKPESF